MYHFTNKQAQSGWNRLGHHSIHQQPEYNSGAFNSKSPYIHIEPDEIIAVVDKITGSVEQMVEGRSLAPGDQFYFEGRLYQVIRRSSEYGAAAKEVAYAPSY